jgi:hypothetical protein
VQLSAIFSSTNDIHAEVHNLTCASFIFAFAQSVILKFLCISVNWYALTINMCTCLQYFFLSTSFTLKFTIALYCELHSDLCSLVLACTLLGSFLYPIWCLPAPCLGLSCTLSGACLHPAWVFPVPYMVPACTLLGARLHPDWCQPAPDIDLCILMSLYLSVWCHPTCHYGSTLS